jgi:hypothetical protein
MRQVYFPANMGDFYAEEIGSAGGTPPTMVFWRVSGISGLGGDPGVKVLIPDTLEAKYSRETS